MTGRVIKPANIALPVGVPISPGKMAGNIIFTSGLCAYDAEGNIVGIGDIRAQTRQTLENVMAVLRVAGAGAQDVVKTVVYLTDFANYDGMNEVYRDYFKTDYPARACVSCELFRKDLLVEIEAVAVLA